MSGATVGRQQIIDTLAACLEPEPFIQAAWMGGSDASGRTDRWSDVDLVLLVDDDKIEESFRAVRHAVESLSPITHQYRMPKPTWHGHDQEFFNLRDAEDFHFVDLVVMGHSSTERFLEAERHGEPLVLFDKTGRVKSIPLDRERHNAKMAERIKTLRATFPLFQNLVTKAVLRRDGVDAMQSLLAFAIRPLVELLRMRYSPARYDYGLRYLDRDLPPELRAEIETMVLPAGVDQIESHRARAEALFNATLGAQEAGEWRPEVV